MNSRLQDVKDQILAALQHPEAEDGLYFENLCFEHEAEERPMVEATQEEILDGLKELIAEGKVRADESGEQIVFFAAHQQ